VRTNESGVGVAEDEKKSKKEEKAEKEEKRSTSARKIKDKWRAKEWYKVFAPDMFGGQQVAETLAADPALLPGRIVSVALQDITGDFSKMHIKLNLRIKRVAGFDAHTDFIGHDLTSDYIRRLTRRKHSKMDGVFEARTKDGYTIKIKPMAITEKRIQTSQQKAIRNLMKGVVASAAAKQTLGEIIKDVLSGDMAKIIFKECKPVYPIRKIEIRRSQIIVFPEPGMEMPTTPAEDAEAAPPAAEGTAGVPATPPVTPGPSPSPAPPPPPVKPKPEIAEDGDGEE